MLYRRFEGKEKSAKCKERAGRPWPERRLEKINKPIGQYPVGSIRQHITPSTGQ